MKYAIETQMQGFLQFITLPERGDTMAYPLVEQIRGGDSLLERLDALLEKAQDRLAWAEANYHEDKVAAQAFDYGDVLTSQGDLLLVVTLQRRMVSTLIGPTLAFRNVADLSALRLAVRKAMKALAED